MKTIVIYFSHAGENYMKNGIENIDIGNSEIVARKIKDFIGADLFRIEEVDPYPFKYKECCDVAKDELDFDKRRKAKTYLNNIDNYEQVIIVGPIWWGHYPTIMFSQLETLNFKNKVVKFIVTHEGSGLGSCPSDINKYCKGGNIFTGLALRGHKVNDSDREIKNYI